MEARSRRIEVERPEHRPAWRFAACSPRRGRPRDARIPIRRTPIRIVPEGPVRLTSVASTPVRVFLFKRPYVDAFHLRLAIGMSLLWCDVQVLERSDQGVRTACAIAKSGQPLPGLVLVEDEGDDGGSFERRVRGSELGDLPLAVLGDGEHPGAACHAFQEGADGFISLPARASDLARTGRDIARFWAEHRSTAESHDPSAA